MTTTYADATLAMRDALDALDARAENDWYDDAEWRVVSGFTDDALDAYDATHAY